MLIGSSCQLNIQIQILSYQKNNTHKKISPSRVVHKRISSAQGEEKFTVKTQCTMIQTRYRNTVQYIMSKKFENANIMLTSLNMSRAPKGALKTTGSNENGKIEFRLNGVVYDSSAAVDTVRILWNLRKRRLSIVYRRQFL